MGNRYVSCWKALFAFAAIAAVVLVPFSQAQAAKPTSVLGDQTGSIQPREKGYQDDSPIKRPTTFPRSNYVWQYGAGPYYGDQANPARQVPGVLVTQVGTFAPATQPLVTALPDELRTLNRLEQVGVQHFVVMIDPQTRSAVEIKDAIERLGGAVMIQMDQNSWIARLTRAAHGGLVGSPGVVHIEPYHAAFKLHPQIGRMPIYDPFKAVSETYDLTISLHKGEDVAVVAQAIAQLGGNVTLATGDLIHATVNRSQLAAVAQLEPVFQIFERLPLLPHGEETTTTMQTGSYNNGATPYHDAGIDGSGGGIDGSGGGGFAAGAQVLMVLDSGFQLDAADLSDSTTDAGTAGPAHRKVVRYATTGAFGGQGDSNGCDAPAQGGFTHGHTVAATALGDAQGDFEFQRPPAPNNGQEWRMDGVAPGAKLSGYDASITPPSSSCDDPLFDGIFTGDVYTGPTGGSLGESYTSDGSRIFNFSFGSNTNAYGTQAKKVDDFHWENSDALVFISAGNAGADDDNDNIPDVGTLNSPATSYNALAIGASFGWPNQEGREFFSSSGPAVNGTSVNRVAPQLMAPGGEIGGGPTGFSTEFSCRSGDNDGANPVECDVIAGVEGTSFASPAAAGAALLVRDYFAQGFHPDGTSADTGNGADQVANVSGSLVKAALIASADYMTAGNVNGNNVSGARHRFNNEQGYGRIQLDNVLPLETWSASPTGLLVNDVTANLADVGLPFALNSSVAQTVSSTFEVCNGDEELRVALAWYQPSNALGNSSEDLILTLTAPDGVTTYKGNFFTDDSDKDATLDTGEDCPGIDGLGGGQIDFGQWSLPTDTCDPGGAAGREDAVNPTQAIFLSPHASSPRGGVNSTTATCDAGTNLGFGCSTDFDCPGGTCVGGTPQVAEGVWTIEVKAVAGAQTSLPFSVVVAGGVCAGSSARFDDFSYTCNEAAVVTVTEVDEAGDPGAGLTELEVESRTTVRVFDSNDFEVDCEGPACSSPSPAIGLNKVPGALKYISDPVQLTAGTARDPGNGVLDVRTGDTVEVVYQDKQGGAPFEIRRNTAAVNCEVEIDFGGFVFGQFGQDSETFVSGGCERNARGNFEFGFPDRYMDAGELIHYNFGFQMRETSDLDNVVADLRCVLVDGDSPADCAPDSADCTDPRRENNPTCSQMSILDSPKLLGTVNAGAGLSANFSVQMAASISGSPTIEMVLQISAEISGKSAAGIAIDRQRLNVDELSVFYSTDFPGGGTEQYDINNDEVLENPTTQIGAPPRSQKDYYFEDRSGSFAWSPITANMKNTAVAATAPWNFDGNDGGFTTGLIAVTDEAQLAAQNIANWGEDKNFNGVHDGTCVQDESIACQNFPTDVRCPAANRTCQTNEDVNASGGLDDNWNTNGGCGWQTKAPHFCSANSNRGCFADADCAGECVVTLNPFESTRSSCAVNTDCDTVPLCSNSSGPGFAAQPCETNADCGPGVCQPFPQQCQGAEGTCNLGSTMPTGGVWHTGAINDPNLALCDGDPNNSQCGFYSVITTTGGNLLWWELLTTPVVEKIDTTTDAGSGLPNSQAEILAFDWNQSINIAGDAIYTWEVDTDVAALLPVDLKSDGTILNSGGGAYGAVANSGNPELTDGFSLFAPISTCSTSGGPCIVNEDCPGTETCTVAAPGGVSVNGSVGGNREGDNGCFFDGAIPVAAYTEVGVAGPPDDDQGTDAYVTAAGPIRNATLMDWNGPDMRFNTLEDIYGDTGDTFQGGIGFLSVEGTDLPDRSFGLAVDDVVLRWREFSLTGDATECGVSGSCATIDVDSVFQFTGNEVLEVTVLDECPRGALNKNNCNGDLVCTGTTTTCESDSECPQGTCSGDGSPCNGAYDCADPYTETCVGGTTCDPDYSDPGDDTDCDDDGTPDLIVKASIDTQSDPDGFELVVLNQDPSNANKYTGELPISSTANSVGVLFVAPQGTDNPTVTFTYDDEDDCLGNPCQNSVNPIGWGKVDVDTLVLLTTCTMSVINTPISDNGDGDAFADANETVDMSLTVLNTCPIPVTNCIAVLTTNSDTVDCILDPVIELGDFGLNEAKLSTDTGTFRVSDVTRTTIGQNLTSEFNIAISCDQFDSLSGPQSALLNLDLNVDTGGQTPSTFSEGFEGGLGAFAVNNLDAGIPPDTANGETDADGLVNGDGMRCSIHDPDWPNSNSFGESAALNCYPGPTLARANMEQWQPDGAGIGSPDGGRAFGGSGSLYFGEKLDATLGFTITFSHVEAVETSAGINLGVATPELSWYHQVDMVDSRTVNAPVGESADRGVVQIKVVNGDDSDIPGQEWTRLEPYFNGYDQQGTDNYTNCMFDPIDDGNTEDDFFDPADPDRRLGPSSTCFPEFSYTYHGDTFNAFNQNALGNAPIGPGLAGSLGIGTWVEAKADLSSYKGQRVKLRYLVTGLKVGSFETVQQAFGGPGNDEHNPTAGDDGWWIDSVTVTDVFTNPISLTVDAADNTGLPGCGTTCNNVTSSVAVTPASQVLSAPGQVLELDASGSSADRCVDGVLQYRFSRDGSVLRSWTDDAVLLDAPISGGDYTVEVRCSSAPACSSSETLSVAVTCPGGSTQTITALDKNRFSWGSVLDADYVTGTFTTSTSIGAYGAALQPKVVGGTEANVASTPSSGTGIYVIVKKDGTLAGEEFCNGTTWQSTAGEVARDAAFGSGGAN